MKKIISLLAFCPLLFSVGKLSAKDVFVNTPKTTLMLSLGHVNVRATYSAGFRAPGLDELYYHYFSVNRGKAQISFGNQDLKPEKSHYVALNAEYRTRVVAVNLTGYDEVLYLIGDVIYRESC